MDAVFIPHPRGSTRGKSQCAKTFIRAVLPPFPAAPSLQLVSDKLTVKCRPTKSSCKFPFDAGLGRWGIPELIRPLPPWQTNIHFDPQGRQLPRRSRDLLTGDDPVMPRAHVARSVADEAEVPLLPDLEGKV